MARTLPMTATVNADTKRREIAVVVEHDHGQSFSRAVMPRARKEFKRWVSENIMFGDLAQTGADLGGAYIRDSKVRCTSIIHFTY